MSGKIFNKRNNLIREIKTNSFIWCRKVTIRYCWYIISAQCVMLIMVRSMVESTSYVMYEETGIKYYIYSLINCRHLHASVY